MISARESSKGAFARFGVKFEDENMMFMNDKLDSERSGGSKKVSSLKVGELDANHKRSV